jgi:hypothetical protein
MQIIRRRDWHPGKATFLLDLANYVAILGVAQCYVVRDRMVFKAPQSLIMEDAHCSFAEWRVVTGLILSRELCDSGHFEAMGERTVLDLVRVGGLCFETAQNESLLGRLCRREATVKQLLFVPILGGVRVHEVHGNLGKCQYTRRQVYLKFGTKIKKTRRK